MTVSYSHDDMVQTSHNSRTPDTCPHATPTVTSLRLSLPLFMNERTWLRHGFDHKQILKVVCDYPGNYIWLLVLLYGVDISPSAIKISFATESDLLIGSKSIGLRKLSRYLKDSYTTPEDAQCELALEKAHIDHVPVLPKHKVDKDTLQQLASLIPVEQNIHLPLFNTDSTMFTFQNMTWLPMRTECGAIFAQRTVPMRTYKQTLRPMQTLANRPYVFGKHVLTEEAIIFYCERTTLIGNARKRKTEKTTCKTNKRKK